MVPKCKIVYYSARVMFGRDMDQKIILVHVEQEKPIVLVFINAWSKTEIVDSNTYCIEFKQVKNSSRFFMLS